jgi:hypothetical protein
MNKWEQTVRKVLSWVVIAGLFLGLIFLVAYRYCEQAGSEARKGCMAAGIMVAISGIGAFWPLGRIWWSQKPEGMVVRVFLGGAIRMLLGFVGVVIILLFTNISRKWFLGCYGIFYTVFLLIDCWLMVRLLHYHSLKEDGSQYE